MDRDFSISSGKIFRLWISFQGGAYRFWDALIVEYKKGKTIRVGDGLELPFTGIVKTAKGAGFGRIEIHGLFFPWYLFLTLDFNSSVVKSVTS